MNLQQANRNQPREWHAGPITPEQLAALFNQHPYPTTGRSGVVLAGRRDR